MNRPATLNKPEGLGGEPDEQGSKVELFEHLRREFQHGVGTVSGVARKFGVHRRMVREAVASAVPAPRKTSVRTKPKIEAVKEWVDAILKADQSAPSKQRQTARRIFDLLRREHFEHVVAESTVRQYVREQKARMGHGPQEVFIGRLWRGISTSAAPLPWNPLSNRACGFPAHGLPMIFRVWLAPGISLWPLTCADPSRITVLW